MELQSCCPPCGSPATNIPGTPGADGSAGASGNNGADAFTFTLANFTIPAVDDTVPIQMASTASFQVGMNIFASDGTDYGTFKITAITDAQNLVAKFLGYTGEASPGAVINSDSLVTVGGIQGPSGTVEATNNSATSVAQSLTNSAAQVGSQSVTLAGAANVNYLLFLRVLLNTVAATFSANRTVTVKLRRTNNTAADVTAGASTFQTPLMTTITESLGEVTVIAIPYTTVGVSDDIAPFVSIDTVPSAGSIQVAECSITALRLS
jgi:hypothetical protein